MRTRPLAEPGVESLFRVGQNCWRVEPARRLAFLVDAANYFAAFRAAAMKAQHSIHILGWDIHSRMRLLGDLPDDDLPVELGPFLNALLRRNRRLHINILVWDFAMIYSVEREVLPLLNREWRRHRRLRFRLDAKHPLGASHHQKIAIIDDAVAFIGGIDLTMRRWDTRAHRADDPRRIDPGGLAYAPFHDIQAVVDGRAAAALAELVRDRWRRATGESLPPAGSTKDPWPENLIADAGPCAIAIARTDPGYDGRPDIREIEQLWRDALFAARHAIFIENQYFTSTMIAEVLARRLQEPNGPEIVLVLPRMCHGWLEQTALGDAQGRLIRRLRGADAHDRLRIFYPVVPGAGNPDAAWVRVHSKVLVIDDRLARVGSSNSSNRSMGVDTECDIAIEAEDERTRRAILGFRDGLLAEHLGRSVEEVEAAVAVKGLIGGIAALDDGPRGFARVEDCLPPDPLALHADDAVEANVFDPEKPIDPERFLDDFLPEAPSPHRLWQRLSTWLTAFLALGAVIAVWKLTPLDAWISLDGVIATLDAVRGTPWTPLYVLAGFLLGGLALVPVTLLIAVTAIAFGPVFGFLYALLGALASATLLFAIGRAVGRDAVRRFAGKRLNRISRRLARSGILTVTALRLLPIAPFSVVNLVAGAMHVRFRDYFAGTVLGMAPGILILTALGVAAERVLTRGDVVSIAIFALVLAAMSLVGHALERWVASRPRPQGSRA